MKDTKINIHVRVLLALSVLRHSHYYDILIFLFRLLFIAKSRYHAVRPNFVRAKLFSIRASVPSVSCPAQVASLNLFEFYFHIPYQWSIGKSHYSEYCLSITSFIYTTIVLLSCCFVLISRSIIFECKVMFLACMSLFIIFDFIYKISVSRS